MALIIPTFKQGKITTENAYAKVGRITVDNNTKKATFNVLVYKSKEDKTLLLQVPMQSIDTVVSVDIVKQCYDGLKIKVVYVETQIATMQSVVDSDTTHSDRKKIWDLSVLKASQILVFKDAINNI